MFVMFHKRRNQHKKNSIERKQSFDDDELYSFDYEFDEIGKGE